MNLLKSLLKDNQKRKIFAINIRLLIFIIEK